ncbi:hypothetical protein [Changpingibacter yushuensis]|uniref:hypothetical protein n=1 Tax=Changpingibacter yushuensis TaxID=2758440 RepID=UPI0015F6D7AC|nr:hypothetical protein [Changpingibacter yushuensis]
MRQNEFGTSLTARCGSKASTQQFDDATDDDASKRPHSSGSRDASGYPLSESTAHFLVVISGQRND